MKKRNFKLLLIFTSFIYLFVSGINLITASSTVRAFGELNVDFHIPEGEPIFKVNNLKPGDIETRSVDLQNTDNVIHTAFVKGVKTGGYGNDPKLENSLQIIIKDGSNVVYGPKTVQNFFTESMIGKGILLGVLNSGVTKPFNFEVTFPTNATNEFQNKSVIFDLIFGVTDSKNISINEVYYNVSSDHGLDSPADRGLNIGGLNLSITDNGTNSLNRVFVDIENNCTIYQVNNLNVNNIITINQKSGNNTKSDNTAGNNDTQTGSISSDIYLKTIGNVNKSSCNNIKKHNKNHEWVELYNPTDKTINLKNYSLHDNSLLSVKLPQIKLSPGQFLLISKDSSTWNHYTLPSGVKKVNLGKQIGDGLNDNGDHLILKDKDGVELDRMSWGTDTTGYTPAGNNPQVSPGSSTVRLASGFDTDAATDWKTQLPPSPGN